MKLKKGDEVKVVRGKDKGKTEKKKKNFPKLNKVVVPNVNLYKRHLKARSQRQPSEIITLTKPLHVSNVKLVCPKCHLPARVGYKIDDGSKTRICRKCSQEI